MNLEIMRQRAKAFDYLFDAVVVTDLEGTIVDWNAGSETLYGYSKEEALGQAVSILHVPEDSASITQEVIKAVQKEGRWTGEIRMLRKDGSIGWIESMCVPIYDDDKHMVGAIGINRDITVRKTEVARLEHQAHYDSLTNIPNRYLLLDRINHLISQSEREKHLFCLLFIDLDGFKEINDEKGHAFGDHILIEVAQRLKNSIRNSDTVARIGGDEFIVLLEDISNKEDGVKMLRNLSTILSKQYSIDGQPAWVGCSIGMATYPEDGVTRDSLMATADRGMYHIKRETRTNSVNK